MGLKGNLSTVNLSEVFQVLQRGNSTGLLRIQAPEGPRYVELQNGAISIAGRSGGHIMLGDLLVSRGLIDDQQLEDVLKTQKGSGQLLGQTLIEMGLITLDSLEEALRFQIEEEVCELFTLRAGEFDFLESASLDARLAPAGGMVRLKLNLSALLEEAARRAEEWKTLEQRIPSQSFIFQLTEEGSRVVRSGEGLSPEGMILLRLGVMHRTVEAMVQKACLGRFNTNHMLLELWDAGYIQQTPMAEYEPIAREHLRLNRDEEAQRAAGFLYEYGEGELKDRGKALLAEIEKLKRRPPPSATAAKVSADPKVRSEVIRRKANLMIKKEKSILPLATAVLLLLGVAGVAVYFTFFTKPKTGDYSLSEKQLGEMNVKAQDLIAARKYAEALQVFRDFTSHDTEVKKQAKEMFQRRQAEIENLLKRALDNFNQAYDPGNPDRWKAEAEELARFEGIAIADSALGAKREIARQKIEAYKQILQSAAAERKLSEIKSAEKSAGSEATQKALQALLAENPAEEVVAAPIRDDLLRLAGARREALRLARLGRDLAEAGELGDARQSFEAAGQSFPGSDLAQEARQQAQDLARRLEAQQAEFKQAESLAQDKKIEPARAALRKFVQSGPPREMRASAIDLLQTLDDGKDAQADALAIAAAGEAQPREANRKTVELVEKHPFSTAAASALWKTRLSTVPEGAEVRVNGTPVGRSPLELGVNAAGPVWVSIRKDGCEPHDIIRKTWREESVNATLNRKAQLSRRMPRPARAGLGIFAGHLVLIDSTELVLAWRKDLKVTRRVNLFPPATRVGEEEAARLVRPLSAATVLNGEAWIPRTDKLLSRVVLAGASGDVASIALNDVARSAPVLYSPPEGKAVIGLSTRTGFESFNFEERKPYKVLKLSRAESATAWGAAFDDATGLYFPRGQSLLAIEMRVPAVRWEAKFGETLCGNPVLLPGRNAVACIGESGRIAAYDCVKGEPPLWKHDTDAGKCSPLGLCAVPQGLVLLSDKGVIALRNASDGAAVWSTPLGGQPMLPAVRIATQPEALAVCVQGGSSYALVLVGVAKGQVLWRADLDAAPVAMTFDGERLYVSTLDGDVLGYDPL